jgi:hypothetical protein
VLFAPDDIQQSSLRDLAAGGVTSQFMADTELARYLTKLRMQDFSLNTLLFHDPWIEKDDLRNLGPDPEELITIQKGVYYLHEFRNVDLSVVRDFRSRCVSFLRVMYILTMSTARVLENARMPEIDISASFAGSIKYVVVNACDDETWIVSRVLGTDAA